MPPKPPILPPDLAPVEDLPTLVRTLEEGEGLEGALFSRAVLAGEDLSGLSFRGCRFDRCRLVGCDFTGRGGAVPGSLDRLQGGGGGPPPGRPPGGGPGGLPALPGQPERGPPVVRGTAELRAGGGLLLRLYGPKPGAEGLPPGGDQPLQDPAGRGGPDHLHPSGPGALRVPRFQAAELARRFGVIVKD